MRKITGLLGIFILFTITGCFDTKEEITITDNGSGTYVATSDMSKLLTLLKTMGGEMGDNKELKEIQTLKKDTVIRLADLKDSLKNLTDAEKKLLDNATFKIVMNGPEEQMSFQFAFPFSSPTEINAIKNVLDKSKQKVMEDKLKGVMPGADDNPKAFDKDLLGDKDSVKKDNNSGVDEYYNDFFTKGKLSRKINKEKYAKVSEDEDLKMLQQVSQMGMATNIKIVINLPKPAKKAEGKSVKLSDDKKQVTIEGSLDDFFEDGSYFEYEIEY